jgi:uncharacterized protein (DUF2062 family)
MQILHKNKWIGTVRTAVARTVAVGITISFIGLMGLIPAAYAADASLQTGEGAN